VTRRRLSFAVWFVCCVVLASVANVFTMWAAPARAAASPLTTTAQAQPTPAPQTTPTSPATSAAPQVQAANDEPIGNVATLTGSATVTRNNTPTPLKLQDDIFLNDVLQTSANSTLGVTFNDATTFNLTANATITVDNFVYEEGGKQNAALFDVARGTVAFAAAAVAKTGDMKISTPSATLGIRGTSGLVEVPEGASATNPNNVAIKLYPDADGTVGRIEVNDRAGARLGFLTQGASGFTIRRGAGGRFAALPLAISPQQAQRDQGFVRQAHAAQSVGRQLVTQKRIQRLQNPPRQPGPQRQNGLPQRPGLGQPGLQRQPNAPGVQKQGLQKLRPGLPAPKRLPKEKR
jgi:hypothetical protein